ncbi:MAG: hypothetical protein ACREQ1_14785, partial [Woeseiaceae bacterium]
AGPSARFKRKANKHERLVNSRVESASHGSPAPIQRTIIQRFVNTSQKPFNTDTDRRKVARLTGEFHAMTAVQAH